MAESALPYRFGKGLIFAVQQLKTMAYKTLKLVEGEYRLSYEMDCRRESLEILREAWDGEGGFDFYDAIHLSLGFFRLADAYFSLCVGPEYQTVFVTCGDQRLHLEVGMEEIHLSIYFLEGANPPELIGNLDLQPSDWAEILPVLAAAFAGGEG
jgi:hypothetical protein